MDARLRDLRDDEDDLRDLFENAPCGYISALPDGLILRANGTLANWLGCGPEALIGRRFQDLLNIAGKIYFETHFAPLLRMQGFFDEVALELTHDGVKALPVLVNARERRDEQGQVRFIRITVFNAVDRRRYERELLAARKAADAAREALQELNTTLEARVAEEVSQRLQAEEALRQAQKMEAIGQLTGGVAHDFNNLLTVIMGGVETIQRQLKDVPAGHAAQRIDRAATMAMHGAKRAATLTSRLLAFSRRQPLDPKAVDVNQLVIGLADLLQRTLGETIALETVAGAGLWRTLADPSELENALVNLAVNARDAMPGGGRLTIECTNVFLGVDYVDSIPEPVPPGQYVLTAVSDSGQGMSPETLSRVFEPFFTTKPAGKGTGLGLSQVYGFVRQSGGHVRIYSEVGVGTTVKIYLPRLSDQAPEPVHEPLIAMAQVHGGSETILLVEDHQDLRQYGANILEDLGYIVRQASSAPEALAILDRSSAMDLLLTDVVLPEGKDGRQLADEVTRRFPKTKVLFTTGYTRNAIVHQGRLDRGVHLISKPFTADELALKVRQVLDL